MAFEFFNKLFDFTPKPTFKNGGIAIVEATPEELKARWEKKKVSVETLANSIRKLRYNLTTSLKSTDEKEALTALVIAVMDRSAERIGNSVSENEGHLGVTGFTKKNVFVEGGTVRLTYVGKSGVSHDKSFTDENIAEALKRAMKNSPNKYVFCTSDNFRIRADRVNRFLENFGDDETKGILSAKSIRGFCANDFMVKGLSKIEPEELKDTDEKKRLKLFNKVAKSVAAKVGHSKATLKKHYLLPEVEENFIKDGTVINLTEFYNKK